jgi:hypothetical protein
MSAVPRLKTTAFLPLETPVEHFNLLHTPAEGTAILWEREGTGKRWHKLKPGDENIPAMLAAQVGQNDRYLTVNEFRYWRQIDNLKSLRALYVDIDRYLTEDELSDALHAAKLPWPSLVVWTGRGVHCYWLHNPLPPAVLPVWQRCQDTIIKSLVFAGADRAAKDCSRVLRLAGTVNSKNGEVVRGRVYDPAPWSFHDLCDGILGPRPEKKSYKVRDLATARAERGQRLRTGSIYDWWHLVYRDLIAIADRHQSAGGIPEKHRNTFLFLSSVALSWFANADTLEAELFRRAQRWTCGLSHSEVSAMIRSAVERSEKAAAGQKVMFDGKERDPRYWFKRETLYGLLQPIIPEELAPKLRAIVSDEVRAEHKRETDRKHEATRAPRDRVDEGRHQSHERGPKVDPASAAQQKPWEALGISRRTYYRRKENGSL